MLNAGEYFHNVRSEIAPLLPSSVESVLELGCGAGETMRWLRSRYQIAYSAGIEISPGAADFAREVFDEVEVTDVAQACFPFRVQSFDLVLALDVLEHLLAPEAALAKLRDRLPNNGLLVVSLPNVSHFEVAWPLFFRGQWTYRDHGLLDRTHVRFFTEQSASALLRDAGFKIQRLTYNRRIPHLLGPFGLKDKKWRWYNQRLFSPFFVWPRHWFNYQFLIAAQRA